MKNIVKSLFIALSCFAASTLWATSIADLNFEITSSTSELPTGYVYSSSNTPNLKTQNNIKCIIISDGGGSTAPTFNDPADPNGGKRWMAFCPDVDCEVTIGIMSNRKKFFIQSKDGEFYSYTNAANVVEEQTVTGLKAGKWYAMCGGSSQVYITKMSFKAAGPVVSSDATLKSIVYGSDQTPIQNFSANQLSYEVELPSDYVGGAPSVQAEANDTKANVNITQATTLPGTATIDVTAEDGTTKLQYTVTFSRASTNPKVLSATWDNIEGTATIDQVNKTITGQVKNGSSLILTPTFSGNNIQSWFPDDATDFSQGAVEYIFSSPTGPTETYMVTITEAPAAPAVEYCAELYPAATGGTPAKGAEVALKAESHGGKIIFADAKDDNFEASFTYTEFGLQMNKGGKDSVRVVLESLLQAGSVIKLDIYQSTIDTKERGFNLLTSGKQSVLKAIWVPSDTDKERTFEYTVVANDGIEGTASFLIQRNNSAVLKGVLVTNCGGTPTPPEQPVAVESVTLNKKTLTLEAGQTETLTATVKPDKADNKKISWESDNTAVATVDANGKVNALNAGTANIIVTTEDGGKTDTCVLTVTEPSTLIEVESISIKAATTIKEGASETLSVTYTPSNANTGKAITWTSDTETVATVDANGKVTGVAAGTAIITATTENGKKATCTVTVEEGSSLPDVGLETHTPEIYEDPKGYNTPLVKYKDREYEVYYTAKGKIGGSGDGVPLVYVNESGSEISNATKAKDGWFEYSIKSGDGADKAQKKDEFTVERGTWKTTTDNYLVMQVKGYDQFRFFAAEKKDSDPNQQLHVFIDDLEHEIDTMKHSTSATIREFNISTDEHVIKITATGSSNQYIYGWSLRVTEDPIVRYLAGPKEQTVYQTKDIQRVSYRVRRAASYRLTWVGNKAIDGVTLREGGNDSVYVEGTANAAAGTYIYKLEALDKDGEVRSSEQGTITIQTHIFDAATGNDFTTNIAEEIKPLNFLFYASEQSSITLNTDISGLALTFVNDSTVRLTGTPAITTTEGEHTYTITAAGGNTISGVITIVVPDPYFEPFAEAKTRDHMAITFTITARHASDVTVQGLPDGFTVRYDTNTDNATISGTPNVGGGYPKTFEFTVTASPRYAGKTQTSTSGKLIVLDPAASAILVTTKKVEKLDDEPIAKYLSDELHYDVTIRQQDVLAGSSYDMFDLILISEDVDANNPEIFKIIRGGVDLPILNMKAFSYAHSIDSLEEEYGGTWGEADNGSLSENGKYVTVWRDDHPIFKALNKKQGDRIQVLDSIVRRGLMPIKVTKQGGLCLATALKRDRVDYYGDGDPETFMHEKPAGLDGGNSKYISFPISTYSSKYLSDDGKALLKATIDYLLGKKATVSRPDLRIEEFKLGDIVIRPNIGSYTIVLEIDTTEHPELADLSTVVPEITLASPYTYTIPAQDSVVNMSYAPYIAFNYIVSDYIHREVYDVKVVWRKPQGIEEVYSVGEWVNIYDIFGRKIATTNEDIYTMSLPRGVYIIVTENGQTLKISR